MSHLDKLFSKSRNIERVTLMVEIQALGQGVRCGAPHQGHSVEPCTKVTGQKFLKLTQPIATVAMSLLI